jgi:Tol biopolymer transport system component/Zn-dependent M28 family amino/carboxypeptidase
MRTLPIFPIYVLLLIALPCMANEAELLSNTRQLTFDGKRAGEGYFSADGSKLVFQSERSAENPFYSIYLLDLETGDTNRVSPDYGKTTCAWIHPSGERVMFASTHDDPKAREKMKTELDFRASGKTRRYSWDYDETYELYAADTDGGNIKRLTNVLGYDAEGAYSPDGMQIVFASNRKAYEAKLSEADAKLFEKDPASMMDIYVMNSDGSNVRQLTTSRGYDGGPFFSADGGRICWRRFSEDGHMAEIFTMKTDGSDQRQLTRLKAMSWAPYFHPTGKYLIFTTNKHGFGNFELYLVRADGKGDPVRVTDTEGFDGLPVFSPDGKKLSWTCKRSANKTSQIFMADWNHGKALTLLGLDGQTGAEATTAETIDNSAITGPELIGHIAYLASEELEGRLTGTIGEKMATDYAAKELQKNGLYGIGDNKSFFHAFEFTAGVDLGDGCAMTAQLNGKALKLKVDDDWRPLAFSMTGDITEAGVVFANYGIVAPATEDIEEYDSYVHLDVQDKWVMVLRFMPEGLNDKTRHHFNHYSSLRYKAMVARDRGAKGLIVVSGPQSKVKRQLVPLAFDASLAGTSIAVISVTDDAGQRLLKAAKKDLGTLQKNADSGEPAMGLTLKGVTLGGSIDIAQQRKTGRNVVARLKSANPKAPPVIIGAHIDHLGRGTSGSLARSGEESAIHYGADDNASGVAAVLEIAEQLAADQRSGKLTLKRDLIVGLWSGEEIGLLGSNRFAADFLGTAHSAAKAPAGHGHGHGHGETKAPAGHGHGHGEKTPAGHGHALPAPHKAHGTPHAIPTRKVAAYVNLDMIGRLDKALILQGIGSSNAWLGEIERRNIPIGLPITTQADSYLPTDATSFYVKGVPVLSAFTGAHKDYHSPRDTVDKINLEGTQRISKLIYLITRSLLTRDDLIDYQKMSKPKNTERRANLRAYLGTVPDYSGGDVKGVMLSGVANGGPAEKAGVKSGDVIVGLAGRKIENIYDYTYAIEALKIGRKTTVKVKRGDKVIELELTPGSRD